MKNRATISAMGGYLPAEKITNADLERTVETDDEWIRTRTGIKERRRVAVDENCSDIGAKACLDMLDNAFLFELPWLIRQIPLTPNNSAAP